MLKLSRAQYKQLCADCAAEMMRGAGHGGRIPDFSGTDMKFYGTVKGHCRNLHAPVTRGVITGIRPYARYQRLQQVCDRA
eukprot:COSAG03_NODE_4250_length_1621_cov_1.449409_3_plen_79_part_01